MGSESDTSERTIAIVQRGLRSMHTKMRDLIKGLDRDALNWKPHPEANSVAVLITHTLRSERELIGAVRGVIVGRDRPSEFVSEADQDELLKMVDEADAWLAEQTDGMTGADLQAERPRANDKPQLGLVWLLIAYGHGREHLAHLELTRQLLDGRTKA
jgi:DinB superfamily